MKAIYSIDELIGKLKLKRKKIHPDFYMFQFSDVGDVEVNSGLVHHKEYFEITIAKEDHATVTIGANEYTNLSSTISFISPGQAFAYLPNENVKDSQGICILFRSEFLSSTQRSFHVQNSFSFFKIHSNPVYRLSASQLDELYALCEIMYSEFANNERYSVEIIRSYLNIILNKSERILSNKPKLVQLTRYQEIASSFEDIVQRNTAERKTIKDYAATLNISPIYLSECVKKTTGKTAKSIIVDYQILQAKAMLFQSQQSINEIALELGFDETTNFTKFFKKYAGTTPKEFRKLNG